jgi:FPC/CPF motif-containing protein YcgG
LLVQSRDGFDVVAGNTAMGRNARRIIREKLEAYDRVPIYPALGHYGAPENREWKQYFVPETNEPMSKRCPFHPETDEH